MLPPSSLAGSAERLHLRGPRMVLASPRPGSAHMPITVCRATPSLVDQVGTPRLHSGGQWSEEGGPA